MQSSNESRPLTNLGWVRPAAAVAALGFTSISLLVVWLQPADRFRAGQDIVTAVLCWGAFFWAATQPRRAALFAICVIGLELTEVMMRTGAINPTTSLILPLLVVAIGLLFGTRAMVGAAAAASLAILLGPPAGRWLQGLPRVNAEQMVGLALVEIELLAAVFFGQTVLSAYKKLLAETERSRQRYHQLFEHAPDGLVELDELGRMVEANPVALKLLGLTAAPPEGRLLAEVLQAAGGAAGFDLAKVDRNLPLAIELGQGPDARFIEIAARAQPGTGSRTLLVLRDSTARRLTEARQEQAQRLETVGRLAGGIAHDFNNLLTAIGGSAELLRDHTDRAVVRLADNILAAQQRAAHLIRQLLSFAQHDFRQPETVSLLRETAGWGDMLRRQTDDHCRLVISGDEQGLVVADAVQIQRILLNLVSNASDASPKGAVIEVRFKCLSLAEAARLGSSLSAERQVLVEVADRGCGMTAEVKSRLFEPFFTTKPQGKGTGLGLAAVHGLVAQNNGAIEIESAVNQGTTVRIFFPEAPRV